ncbi:MAG TPA: peptide deformylase [Candidatus Sphingobacterium stercorigallinarum]|nr:peptide deformylase [Candidatus Sphingobacterium stercorigallinarum]
MRLILFIALWLPIAVFAQDYSRQITEFRQQQAESMTKDQYGPIRANQIQFLNYFAPDTGSIVRAEVELLIDQPVFSMPTYDGTSNPYKRYAVLHFQWQGQPVTLTAYQSVALFQNPAYQDHLFLPFLDETNGADTYEGGRYIDLSIKDIKNGTVQIDFNRAYNPYCAYSNGYRCPQPPRENSLPIAILAGEKKYTGPKNERNVNPSTSKTFDEQEKQLINSGDDDSIMYVYQTTNPQDLAVLTKPSDDIRYDDPLLDKLADRMLKTVQDPKHPGVGIAGPQVGINKNVIWVQRLDKTGAPFEFYVNPKILWRSELKRTGPEGCLSIPDRKEDVLRSYAIRLQHIDRKGEVKEELIEGFTAVIFQHEVDHLYGILFPDRIEETETERYIPLADKIHFSIEKGTIIP